MDKLQSIRIVKSREDPGFPVGGGTNCPGGYQHTKLPNFPKNCMNLRKFQAVGGHAPLCPPKSATEEDIEWSLTTMKENRQSESIVKGTIYV